MDAGSAVVMGMAGWDETGAELPYRRLFSRVNVRQPRASRPSVCDASRASKRVAEGEYPTSGVGWARRLDLEGGQDIELGTRVGQGGTGAVVEGMGGGKLWQSVLAVRTGLSKVVVWGGGLGRSLLTSRRAMPVVAAQGQVELADDGCTAVARARGTCGGDGLGIEADRGMRQGDAGVASDETGNARGADVNQFKDTEKGNFEKLYKMLSCAFGDG